jgi:hypothetical protein
MPIELSFDLPYSLQVDGQFVLNALGESFDLTLSTVKESNPRFPGAESVENIAIVNDDSNILSHTHVQVSYTPRDEAEASDPAKYSRAASEIAIGISNALISAVYMAYGEYHLEYLYSADRLGPISFNVPAMAGRKPFSGSFDGLQGGITFARPARTGSQAVAFAGALAAGAALAPASELLFNARRYLRRGNKRMALANLAISFEVGLADRLTEVAVSRNDQALEQQIARAALNELGTGLALRTLGHSFAERKYWSNRFADAFDWLRTARNGVLHKAQLNLTFGGHTRDFSQMAELKALFAEHDWLVGQIEVATARVLAGKPALV